jgi:hypothetical protein
MIDFHLICINSYFELIFMYIKPVIQKILNFSIVKEKISLELLDYRPESIIYVGVGFVY